MSPELYNKIPINTKDPCSYVKTNYKSSFFLSPTSEKEILNIIAKLKNSSPGHDGTNIKIIKIVILDILSPLVHLCNLSFFHGVVPSSLKLLQ